jgi:hypothetical protein
MLNCRQRPAAHHAGAVAGMGVPGVRCNRSYAGIGGVQHTVSRHWTSLRESAEFPTSVKKVLAMLVQSAHEYLPATAVTEPISSATLLACVEGEGWSRTETFAHQRSTREIS